MTFSNTHNRSGVSLRETIPPNGGALVFKTGSESSHSPVS